MSSTDTNRRIPSTATVLIALALAFLAAIAMAACAPADLPTAPDLEEAFPIASASAAGRSHHPTMREGEKAETYWLECPPQGFGSRLECVMGPKYATLYSVDDDIVQGDWSPQRYAISQEVGQFTNTDIKTVTVLDDDTAYVTVRSRVTGYSWPKRADHDDRQFPLALICQHWHDVNGSNEIGAAGWVDIVPTLCSRDYQYIWEYLGTQTAWIDCTVGDAVTSTTMRYQTNQAWVDGTLWPAYRGGCRTYTPERAWFFSLSKPLRLDPVDGFVTADHFTLQLIVDEVNTQINRIKFPTRDGEYTMADLALFGSGGFHAPGPRYCGLIDRARTYTGGLNGGAGGFDSPQIIVEYPDGMDLCHP